MGVVADPVNAATIRQEFADWLGEHFNLDATKTSDVVLAVNEALANAAEYAYATAPRPGAMHVRAEYDCSRSTLTVTVSDEGTWRASDRAPKDHKRGRGLPLMHALADQVTLDSSQTGTRVCLEWAHVPAARSPVHA
jgi:anti-sigma regulatory factor (Ser/Thr protein kinase)